MPSWCFSQILCKLPSFLIDNSFMGIFKDQPFLFGVHHGIFVFVGLLMRTEVDRMPHIFGFGKDAPDNITTPVIRVGKFVKCSKIVYRLCNHMVYTLSLIQPGVIVQEIALFECVNSLVQVDAADSELSEHQCDLPRERRLANGDAFPTKPFA